MKNIKKHKKILMLVSAVLSLLIFVPIGLFIPKITFAMGMITETEPSAVEKVLSYPVTSASLLIPVVFFLIMLLTQMIIGAYLVVKAETRAEKVMGYLTSIFGGFGMPAVYLAIQFFRKDSKKVKGPKGSKFIKVGALTVSPLLAIAPVAALAGYAGFDVPTKVDQVLFSLNKTTPNVIEIFSDGMDWDYIDRNFGKDWNTKDGFEDFNIYPKTVTSGAETSFSLPTIMRGLKDGNFFNTHDKPNSSSNREALYASLFGEAFADHMNKTPLAKNENSYVINVSGVNKQAASYAGVISGEPDALRDMMDSYPVDPVTGEQDKTQPPRFPLTKHTKLVNYAQVKDDLAGKFGISNHSQDVNEYKWLEKKATTNAKVPARLWMQEYITHAPRFTAPDGTWTSSTKDPINDSFKGLHNSLTEFFNKLKSMKDKQTNVFDNSMIIIYGDHSNHSRKLARNPKDGFADNKQDSFKWNSVSMVKYPKHSGITNATNNIITDRTVYVPFVNQIINNFINKWSVDPTGVKNFIGTNDNFRLDRDFLGFFDNEGHYMHFTNKDNTGPFPNEYDKFDHEYDRDFNLVTDRSYKNTNSTGWLDYDQYLALNPDKEGDSDSVKTAKKAARQLELLNKLDWQGGAE